MVLYSGYQTRLSDAGTGLASGVCILRVSGGRKARAECLYWSRRKNSLEKEYDDGSDNGIRGYEEGVCPQTVKRSIELSEIKCLFRFDKLFPGNLRRVRTTNERITRGKDDLVH